MTKSELKELIGIIVFSIINITIAYIITGLLGIQNVILYQSIATVMQYTITYEILIFLHYHLLKHLYMKEESFKRVSFAYPFIFSNIY